MTAPSHAASFDWLAGLEHFGIKLGLESITTILEARGRPERAYRTVHIAGTNGKGSVTAMVDEALRAAGYRTARYTSPHLVDLTERFVIDGRPVDREDLADAVADVRASVDELRRGNRLSVQPTFFEITTAVAFDLFRRAGVDLAVCEVGLGGRLDATNVLEPIVSAITSIGLDHQEHLGSTRHEIAIEKAGIIKRGVPVVVGRIADDALAPIEAIARTRGAALIRACDGVTTGELAGAGNRFRLRTPACDYGEVEVALAGAHQRDNAVVAVRLLEVIGSRGLTVPMRATVEGLARVRWPGRLESRRLPQGREVLLDAAHNADGAAALARFLASAPGPPRPLVFAVMHDKDAAGMLRALVPAVASLVLTRASSARSADPRELASIARAIAPDLPLSIHSSPRDALTAAWELAPRIVAAGSIFLLGDVIEAIDAS
jgi:dihydrofolate synthase/folylpolyglutamate synthase